MCDENKNEVKMRDDRNVNGGMRDKITSAGAEFAHFDWEMRDVFKIAGGMRDAGCGIKSNRELQL